MSELIKLGELIDTTAPPSRAPTPFEMPYNPSNIPQEEPEEEPEQNDNMHAHIRYLTDMACEPPRHPMQCPQGTSDNPFGLDHQENPSFS
jgi:hypothetical protein